MWGENKLFLIPGQELISLSPHQYYELSMFGQ